MRGIGGTRSFTWRMPNRGEGGAEARWVVLLDRVPHSALHDARVVELRASDGKLLIIRAPRAPVQAMRTHGTAPL